MKLANTFTILPRFLNAFNYVDTKVETPKKEIKQTYWEKECLEHPTNNHCLIYCDQKLNFEKFFDKYSVAFWRKQFIIIIRILGFKKHLA